MKQSKTIKKLYPLTLKDLANVMQITQKELRSLLIKKDLAKYDYLSAGYPQLIPKNFNTEKEINQEDKYIAVAKRKYHSFTNYTLYDVYFKESVISYLNS